MIHAMENEKSNGEKMQISFWLVPQGNKKRAAASVAKYL